MWTYCIQCVAISFLFSQYLFRHVVYCNIPWEYAVGFTCQTEWRHVWLYCIWPIDYHTSFLPHPSIDPPDCLSLSLSAAPFSIDCHNVRVCSVLLQLSVILLTVFVHRVGSICLYLSLSYSSSFCPCPPLNAYQPRPSYTSTTTNDFRNGWVTDGRIWEKEVQWDRWM